MKSDHLILKRKGGGSIIDHRPLFSQNGETLYIVWKQDIRAYSTQTADFVREFDRADDRVIKIITCPKNPDTIVGCTEHGSLISWDSKTGLIKLSVNLELPDKTVKIKTFHIVTYTLTNQVRIYDVLVSYISEKDGLIHLETYNYADGRPILQNTIKRKIKRDGNDQVIHRRRESDYYLDIVGNHGYNLIALGDNMHLNIINPQTLLPSRYDIMGRTITCITGHPTEECVAVGDESGRVLLLWEISLTHKERNMLPQTTYHWHTLPVEEIAFSRSGGYMYSGGGECVLVKWTINDVNHKSFLPRLPAPIKHLTIAPGNIYVSISTYDNGITIINPQKMLTSVIQNFAWGVTPANVNLFPAGLIVDPRTNCLVLNSRTGHIQFYNIHMKTLLYNINITAQNLLTQERHTVIVNTEVTKIAMNYNGTWMATLEERDDKISSIEIRLKFWEFDLEKQTFVLNTSIELPHDVGVNALLFQPGDPFGEQNPFVVTTGKDKRFKLWSMIQPTSVYKKTKHWECESVGYYRDLPTNDAAFSEDGSLLAVGFDCTLTLWNPETMEFKKALSYFDKRETIKQIEFGRHEARHLVVVGYPSTLVVWDILTFRVKWNVPLKLSTLTADPLSSYMAAFTTDNTLYVFKPTKSKYKYTKKSIIQNSKILCSCFAPQTLEKRDSGSAWQKYSQLYFLDSNQELLTLEPEFESESLLSNLMSTENLHATTFSRLLAAQTVSCKEKSTPYIHEYLGNVGKEIVDELISYPAHTLPPMSLLCNSFLLYLSTKPTEKQPIISENGQTLDSDSDDDYSRTAENADNNSASVETEDSCSSKLEPYDWSFLSEVVPISETI